MEVLGKDTSLKRFVDNQLMFDFPEFTPLQPILKACYY